MDPLAALRSSPASAALFVDFDGTLAPIVTVADAAVPLPGVPELLLALRASLGRVAIVSGRPVEYLARHLPPEIELHGLYGLEAVLDGALTHHPGALAWQDAVEQVAAAAVEADELEGVDVEHKGLSLTLHFRAQPGRADAVRTWADAMAATSGLVVRPAKMSLELHPPLAVDKGTVVEARSTGMTAVAYVGDDLGDLPAFDALDRLRARGIATVKVAVRTPDVSATLLARADVGVDGPIGAVTLLRSLLR